MQKRLGGVKQILKSIISFASNQSEVIFERLSFNLSESKLKRVYDENVFFYLLKGERAIHNGTTKRKLCHS